MTTPLNVFICYSHKDEGLKDELVRYLRPLVREGKVSIWQDRDIKDGAEWSAEIKTPLEQAQLILLLVTSNFLTSDLLNATEIQLAMQKQHEGAAKVLPIVLQPYGRPEQQPAAAPAQTTQSPKPLQQESTVVDEVLEFAASWMQQLQQLVSPGFSPLNIEEQQRRLQEQILQTEHLLSEVNRVLQTQNLTQPDIPFRPDELPRSSQSFAEALSRMPNVGDDTDFERIQDALAQDVFD